MWRIFARSRTSSLDLDIEFGRLLRRDGEPASAVASTSGDSTWGDALLPCVILLLLFYFVPASWLPWFIVLGLWLWRSYSPSMHVSLRARTQARQRRQHDSPSSALTTGSTQAQALVYRPSQQQQQQHVTRWFIFNQADSLASNLGRGPSPLTAVPGEVLNGAAGDGGANARQRIPLLSQRDLTAADYATLLLALNATPHPNLSNLNISRRPLSEELISRLPTHIFSLRVPSSSTLASPNTAAAAATHPKSSPISTHSTTTTTYIKPSALSPSSGSDCGGERASPVGAQALVAVSVLSNRAAGTLPMSSHDTVAMTTGSCYNPSQLLSPGVLAARHQLSSSSSSPSVVTYQQQQQQQLLSPVSQASLTSPKCPAHAGLAESNFSSAEASCPVCLSDYTSGDSVTTLPCFHMFHTDCISPWLRQSGHNVLCPLCKSKVFNQEE